MHHPMNPGLVSGPTPHCRPRPARRSAVILRAIVLLAAGCAALSTAQAALVLSSINLNGNQDLPATLDLSTGLDGTRVFTSMNPIQYNFAVGSGTPAAFGFQFIVENESSQRWGSF